MCVLVYACVRVCVCAHVHRYINHCCRIYWYQTCTDSAAAVWILNVFPCWRSGNEVLMTLPAHRRGGGREGWGGGGVQWRCGWAVDARWIALRLTGDLVKERGCKRRQKRLAVCWRMEGTTETSALRADVHQAGPAANFFAPHMIVCSPAATNGFLYFCIEYFFSCRQRDKSPLQPQWKVCCADSQHNPVKSCKDSVCCSSGKQNKSERRKS